MVPKPIDWRGDTGRSWAACIDALTRQLAPVTKIAMEVLTPQRGERILDLGCGGGATTARIAEAVGPQGRAVGIDVSPDLVAIARRAVAHLPQAEIVAGDAARHDFAPASFDALFSRFGCMFFADPPAAFAHLRRAIVPDGRAVLIVYTPMTENLWAAIPAAAAAELLGPAPPQPPSAPGPFGWADPAIFRPILAAAGFGDIDWHARDLEVEIGDGNDPDPVERAIRLVTTLGAVARRLDDAPEGSIERLAPILRRSLAPFVRDGAVRMPARIWIVTARA